MKLIRRHWKLTLIHALVLMMCGAGFLGYMATSKPSASAAPAVPIEAPAQSAPRRIAVDATTYRQVRRLRQTLALTDVDLAAMGCTQASAEAILQKLVDWTRLNTGAIRRQRAGQLAAQRALDEAVRQINVGPKDMALIHSLGQLKRTMASAQARRRSLAAAAAQAVEALLDSHQRQVWAVARANAALPVQWRFVAVSRQEGRQLEQALRKGKTALLDRSRQQAAQAIWAQVDRHMQAVREAVEQVLPVPKELQVMTAQKVGTQGQ